MHDEISVWTTASKTNTSMASGFMSFISSVSACLRATLCVIPLGLWANELPEWQVDAHYASRVVFRGIEQAGPSAQGEVKFTRENFSVGWQASQPLKRRETRLANLHLAYDWQSASGFNLEISMVNRWFSGVPSDEVHRALEIGLAAIFSPIEGFTPSVMYSHDASLCADTAQVGVARSIALTQLGTFIELAVVAGLVSGDNWRPGALGTQRHDNYGYWGGSAQVPYRIGLHTTVAVGVHYADTTGRSALNGPFGRANQHNLWITCGVNLDF